MEVIQAINEGTNKGNLTNAAICRVCLATDVKMYDLFELGLWSSFEDFVDHPIMLPDILPKYICVYCHSLMRKSLNFQYTCQQTQSLLLNLCKNKENVTEKTILKYREGIMKLHQNLSITINYAITCETMQEDIEKETIDSENPLKIEDLDYNDGNTETIDSGKPLKIEDLDYNNGNTETIDSENPLKIEDLDYNYGNTEDTDYTDLITNNDFSHSNIMDANDYNNSRNCDEEIPVKQTEHQHNPNLNIKIVDLDYNNGNTEGTDYTDMITNNDFINSNIIDVNEYNKNTTYRNCDEEIPVKKTKENNSKKNLKKSVPKKKEIRKIKKKKHMYNQKFEEDFILFSKLCNVDVVFLNKEQQLESINKRKEKLLKEHSTKYRFTCGVCFIGFMTEKAYKRHVIVHDPIRGDFVCDVCQNRYPNKKSLQAHVRSHRVEFICKLCPKVSKNSFTAKLHHQWHQGMKFECQHCHKKFNAHSSKMNHVREQHTVVSCDICQLSVNGTVELSRHKRRNHGQVVQTVECTTCGVSFRDKLAYCTHKTGNGCDAASKTCAICGDSFKNDEELTKHKNEKHESRHIFKCSDCTASFSSDRQLGIHRTRCHLPKDKQTDTWDSILCDVCAKSFDTHLKLKYHLRLHTGEKPYKCNYCQKSFRVRHQLNVHVNTHTGERPFKCDFCAEAFKSYAQRYKHKLMVHTKERPHKCTMCDKSYVVSNDLKMHMKFSHLHFPRPPRRSRAKTKK